MPGYLLDESVGTEGEILMRPVKRHGVTALPSLFALFLLNPEVNTVMILHTH